jgi:hypothetical protein
MRSTSIASMLDTANCEVMNALVPPTEASPDSMRAFPDPNPRP